MEDMVIGEPQPTTQDFKDDVSTFSTEKIQKIIDCSESLFKGEVYPNDDCSVIYTDKGTVQILKDELFKRRYGFKRKTPILILGLVLGYYLIIKRK